MNRFASILYISVLVLLLSACRSINSQEQPNQNENAELQQPTSQPVSKEVAEFRNAEAKDAIEQREAITYEKNKLNRLKVSEVVKTDDGFVKMIDIYKNQNETIESREIALNKSLNMIAKDAKQIKYLMNSLTNKNESLEFKKVAMSTLDKLTYSSLILQKEKDNYLKILRQTLESTTDKEFYKTIIEKLSVSHDPFAQQELIRNLRSENYEVLGPIEMMEILKKNMRPEYYPPLHQLMLRTKNNDVKANAVSMLSKNGPSRTYFVKFMSDKNEDNKVRLACLKQVAEEDRASFYPLVRSIVMNESENEKIKMACLKHLKKMSKTELAKFSQLEEDLIRLSNTGSSQNVSKLSREVASKL